MPKRKKAQRVSKSAPPAKRNPNQMTYAQVKGALRRGGEFQAAAAEGSKSKYWGLWCFKEAGATLWAVPVETPQGVEAPAPDLLTGPFPGFDDRDPCFIVRTIRSEVEAALVRDVATLWVKLHEGCTPAQLRATKWNFPAMKVWKDESGLVQQLRRVGPTEWGLARQAVRRLTTPLLPRLPKRLIPDYTLRAMREKEERKAAKKREQEEAARRERMTAEEAEAERKAAEAEIAKAALATIQRNREAREAAARAVREMKAEAAAQRKAWAAQEAARQAAEAAAAKAAKAQAAAKRKREVEAAAARAVRKKQAAAAEQSKAREARAAARAGKRDEWEVPQL